MRGFIKTPLGGESKRDQAFDSKKSSKTPYKLAIEFGVVGSFSSSVGVLAENRKQYAKLIVRAKQSR